MCGIFSNHLVILHQTVAQEFGNRPNARRITNLKADEVLRIDDLCIPYIEISEEYLILDPFKFSLDSGTSQMKLLEDLE